VLPARGGGENRRINGARRNRAMAAGVTENSAIGESWRRKYQRRRRRQHRRKPAAGGWRLAKMAAKMAAKLRIEAESGGWLSRR